MKIKIIDSILCKVDKELIPHIVPCLEFQKSFWRQSQFRKVQKIYKANFINKRTGIFLSGFLPRVTKFLNDKNITFEIEGEFERIVFGKSPNLPGITLRPDQENLIRQAYEKQRGVILSPTGSGKTIVALGFMSMFPKSRILFLCHSFSIISQTAEELKKFEFDNIAILGDGKKNWSEARIVVSTIQTFSKFSPETYCDYFDIVICDECHRAAANQYNKVLQKLLAPIRIGLTATFPKDKEKALTIEGLLGPVIGEVSIRKGNELKIMAKPEIILVTIPEKKIDSYKYKDIYQQCIVKNRIRNRIIVKIIKEIIERKESVLIMIKEIACGENIQKLAKDLYNINIDFVQGVTESKIRERIKFLLEKKEIKAVICTSIWKEGVNLPELNNIIMVSAGKSEITVLQNLGRGLRRTENKSSVRIYDFVDIGKYLSEHFTHRLSIYLKMGWEISSWHQN